LSEKKRNTRKQTHDEPYMSYACTKNVDEMEGRRRAHPTTPSSSFDEKREK
jgi:hypothetical protein